MSVRVLSLDIASSTGWAVMEDKKLLLYGLISFKIKKNEYPLGILEASQENADLIFQQILLHTDVDIIAIERTNMGRARNSQAFLEYSHAFLLAKIKDAGLIPKVSYIDTGKWRKAVGMVLTKEDKAHNKARRASKKVKGGIISKKHLAVRMANEIFGLQLIQKNDDIADSLLIALSCFK